MRLLFLPLAAVVATLCTSGCATHGGWMGADAEKSYDAALDARRIAAELDNDDYYEIHKDGRTYVLADLKDYQTFLATGEIPLAVTKIGGAPDGGTLKMALTKKDAKAMEKIVGYKGAAQRMFEGDVAGSNLGFYGEIHRADAIWVFGDWSSLATYRRNGAATGTTQPGAGPNGESVTFVVAANGDATALQAKFRSVYAKP
jgi:hypothetical protein